MGYDSPIGAKRVSAEVLQRPKFGWFLTYYSSGRKKKTCPSMSACAGGLVSFDFGVRRSLE